MFYGFLNFILFYRLFSNLNEGKLCNFHAVKIYFFLILEREVSTYKLFKQHCLNYSSCFYFEH